MKKFKKIIVDSKDFSKSFSKIVEEQLNNDFKLVNSGLTTNEDGEITNYWAYLLRSKVPVSNSESKSQLEKESKQLGLIFQNEEDNTIRIAGIDNKATTNKATTNKATTRSKEIHEELHNQIKKRFRSVAGVPESKKEKIEIMKECIFCVGSQEDRISGG